jgi:hypothetical protein
MVQAIRKSDLAAGLPSAMNQPNNPAPFVMERIGKVSESDRSFDTEFWQRQGSTAIFAAAWEMVVEAYRFRNRESELSFQRTVENIQRSRG